MRCIAIEENANELNFLVKQIEEVLPNIVIFHSTNPYEIIDYCENNTVEILFCEIEMTNINGLELSKKIKEINPRINIIFIASSDNYLHNALSIHASGYIIKPLSTNLITKEISNLLYPIQAEMSGIYAKTFGNFEIFVNGRPIFFAREKAKEMLAYLIDRRGAMVNKKEIFSILFEDKPYNREAQNYFTKIFSELMKALKAANADKIIIKGYNRYGVDKTKFGCDLYEYLSGNPIAINMFNGEYMLQYEWAEYSIGGFYNSL